MRLHRRRAALLLLVRCLSFADSDESCKGQSWRIVDADALAGRHQVLLQVAGSMAETTELNEMRHRDAIELTLTTTPSPHLRPDVSPSSPYLYHTPRREGIQVAKPCEDVRVTEPVPHNPHENYWYWPWTRPANGNFELGTSGKVPAHWKRFASFGTTGLLSTTQARSGSSSVWFSGPGWELIETGAHGNEKMMVTPGSKYSVTFWARSTAASQNIQTMFVVYTGHGNANATRTLVMDDGAAQKLHYITTENTWQKFTHTFTAGEWTNKVRMNIGPHGASGSVWIDDILFSRDV
jgi:hypothetical protein